MASTVGAARATVCDGLLLLVLLVQQPWPPPLLPWPISHIPPSLKAGLAQEDTSYKKPSSPRCRFCIYIYICSTYLYHQKMLRNSSMHAALSCYARRLIGKTCIFFLCLPKRRHGLARPSRAAASPPSSLYDIWKIVILIPPSPFPPFFTMYYVFGLLFFILLIRWPLRLSSAPSRTSTGGSSSKRRALYKSTIVIL